MYWDTGITNFTKRFTVVALSLLLGQPIFAQSSENQQMAFEGTLTDMNGNPISLAGATLNFYISANGCYLYGESSSTAGDSQGNISHRFGSGTVATGSPNSFSQNLFFGNVTGTTTFAGNNCSVTATDTRLAQVYYPAQNITATIKLGAVPYAQNATRLNGKTDSDFVAANADTSTVFSSGTSGQYLTKGASGLTWTNLTLTAAQISTALGYTPANSASGVISLNGLTVNSQTFAIGSTGNSLTITSSGSIHTFNIPLAGTSSTAGLLSSSDYASFNNKLGQANNLSDISSASAARSNLGLGSLSTLSSLDLGSIAASGTLATARLPSLAGDVLSTSGSNSLSVVKLRGYSIATSAPTTGQVLVYDGTNWGPVTIPNNPGTVTQVNAGTGLSGGPITSSGTLSVNFGTVSGTVAQGNDSRIVNALQNGSNLSDLTNSATARTNLGLGSLATKSVVNLTSDVSGILPIANGGTQWSTHTNGLYNVSNTTIGSSTVFANTRLYVEASSTAQVARFTNTSTSGYGLRIDVAGSSADQYALNVNTGLGSAFMVENDGRVGVGTMNPVTRLDVSGAVRIGFENVTCSSAQVGTIRYFSGALEYCNGSSYKTLSAVSDGLNVLNGLSNPSQNFAIQSSSTETALSISSSGSTHTFTLPMANNSGVTAGLLNNTDYSFFANKLNANATAIATALGYTPANSATVLSKANNLSDVPDKSVARANLGLGTFATASTIDLGSASATGILASTRLPAMSGDISSTAGSASMTLVALRGTSLAATAPVSGQVLKYNGTQWAPSAELWNVNGTSINYTNGNVGIGTTVPTQKLEVAGRALAHDMQATSAQSIGAQGAFLQWNRGSGDGATWLINQKGGGQGGIRFGESDTSNNFTERMRIDSLGNVGIGTTAPTATLAVSGTIESTVGVKFPDGKTQTKAAPTGYEMVSSACTNSGTTGDFTCFATCSNTSKKIISGGCKSSTGSHTIQDSWPNNGVLPEKWVCYYKNVANGVTITAYATCMDVP